MTLEGNDKLLDLLYANYESSQTKDWNVENIYQMMKRTDRDRLARLYIADYLAEWVSIRRRRSIQDFVQNQKASPPVPATVPVPMRPLARPQSRKVVAMQADPVLLAGMRRLLSQRAYFDLNKRFGEMTVPELRNAADRFFRVSEGARQSSIEANQWADACERFGAACPDQLPDHVLVRMQLAERGEAT